MQIERNDLPAAIPVSLATPVNSAVRVAAPAPGSRAPTAAPHLPDAFAPLIRNAWYAVGELKDIDRTLRAIKVLGEPLVMYRTEAGEPVVLDDRCAHRRFSLSKSTLVGDSIQCGYHGFTYAKTGACTWAPGVPVVPKFGVRHYPSAAGGPWLWVWMGDVALADPATIPLPELEADDWQAGQGYKHNPGNYMLLIENFLDLTHLHFLHGAAVSDLRQADNPPKTVPSPPNNAWWRKETASATMGIMAQMYGSDPMRAARIVEFDRQVGASLNWGGIDWYALPGDDRPLPVSRFRVIHCITPEDENNTHQFFSIAFNAPMPAGIAPFIDFSQNVVFEQDVTAIRYMQESIVNDHREGTVEFGIPSDRFGIGMRRTLRKMKAAEVEAKERATQETAMEQQASETQATATEALVA